MKLGIRAKLIFFACAIVLAASATSAGLIYLQAFREIHNKAERAAKEVAALTAASVFDDIYRLDLSRLREKLKATRANSDITYTFVIDSDGVVLSDGTSENFRRDQKLSDPFSALMMNSAEWVTHVEEDLLKVGGPVLGPDKRRSGYLQIGFSLARMQDDLRNAITAIIYSTLIALAIGVVLAYLLGTALSRPIQAIAQACGKIGAGELHTRL